MSLTDGMEQYQIELKDALNGSWASKPTVHVGRAVSPYREADVYGLVATNDSPLFTIAVHADRGIESICFRDAVVWRDWCIIGYGHSVYFVDIATHKSEQHFLDRYSPIMPYFGRIYPGKDWLLVATGSNLLRFDVKAQVVWASKEVGIDGVVIQGVEGDLVRGEGEWDPPGDWRRFAIDLRTGRLR